MILVNGIVIIVIMNDKHTQPESKCNRLLNWKDYASNLSESNKSMCSS